MAQSLAKLSGSSNNFTKIAGRLQGRLNDPGSNAKNLENQLSQRNQD